MLKDVFMEQILCQMYIFLLGVVNMTSNSICTLNPKQQKDTTTIRHWNWTLGDFLQGLYPYFLSTPKVSGLDPRFSSLDSSFLQGEPQHSSVMFVWGSTAVPFQTDLGFDWITLPFHHLGCIGVSQNSIGRLNVELRQSLSADINTEPLGLCVGESVGGMGLFQGSRRWGSICHLNARSCGADREGSQLLERVEGAVTRDLENKKQVGYVYFQSMMRMLITFFLVVEIWWNMLQKQQVFLFDVDSFCFGKMMEN